MNRIYLLVLSTLFLFSCTQTPKTNTNTNTNTNTDLSKSNDLLPSEVVVKDYINIANNDNPDWVKSVTDNKVISTILDIAISEKVTVNTVDEGDTTLMSIDDINSNLGEIKDSMQIDLGNGNYLDTLIVHPAKTEQVEGLFFKENWMFNADNFSFTKQINEYLPVREYYKMLSDGTVDSTKKSKSLVYKVINDNNSKNFEKIADKVTTAFYFNAEIPNFINGLDVLKFSKYLLDYAYKNKKDVYDFYDDTKLSFDEVKYALGASSDTIQMEVTPGNFKTTVLEYEPDASEIVGIIFVENWFLDKQTLSFKKEVIGLAPIRRSNTVDPEGESYTKTMIPYLIKL